MTALTETLHAGGFIVSELHDGAGHLSRETVTVHGGYTDAGVIVAGTVMGQITTGGKWVPSPNSGADGSQTAKGVLFDTVDATDADVTAVIIRRVAEVRASDLTYDTSVDDNTKIATKITQLAAAGVEIIAR